MPLAIRTPDGSIELMQVKKPEGIHLTSIGWCDGSLNLIRAINTRTLQVGWHCSKKSEACQNCYAEAANVRYGTGLDYKAAHLASGLVMQQFDMQRLEAALRWKAPRGYVPVAGDGRLKVFMADMIDLFDESVPTLMIVQHFALALLRPDIDWLILTKLPEKLARLTNSSHFWQSVAKTAADLASRFNRPCMPGMYEVGVANPPGNVWLGTTAEDGDRACDRVPVLLTCQAAVHFMSAEPLLDAIGSGWMHLWSAETRSKCVGRVRWVIVGCESLGGVAGRGSDGYLHLASNLIHRCGIAGIAVYHKQWPHKGSVCKDLATLPEYLRVRRWPKGVGR